MAENKKSFVLYADLIKSIEHLTNEEKGILFNHLLEYVNDMNPILNDRLVLTAWKPIEIQLKRDLIKFEEVKHSRSISGKAGADKRWQKITNDGKGIEAMAKIADNVNDNVNVINIKADVISTDQWGNEIDINGFHIKTKKRKS